MRLSRYPSSYDPVSALSVSRQHIKDIIAHTFASKCDYRTCEMSDNAAVSTNDLPDT